MELICVLSRTLPFLLSCALLAGCGSTAKTSVPVTPPVTPPSASTYTASAQYAYVSTSVGLIDEYSISTAGVWSEIGRTPTVGAPTGIAIAIDPQHRFVYAIGGSDASSTIYMFTVTPGTGILLPTSPASIDIPGLYSQGIAVDGLGKYVYTADTDSDTATSLVINQTTGVLTPTSVSSAATDKEPSGVTTDPSGKYVYVANKGDGYISQYVIDPNTGNLTPNNPASAVGADGPFAGTINAAGTFYYSPDQAGTTITVLALNPATGILSQVASGRIQTGDGPTSVALTQSGKFAYVTNRTESTLSGFSVDPTSGLLTSLGNTFIPGGENPTNIVVDPGNELAYVGCAGSSLVTIFGIESGGQLIQVGSATTDGGPEAIVLVPR